MLSFEETLNKELLHGRFLILELAALLDRLDIAAQREKRESPADARLRPLKEAIRSIASESAAPDRAARILKLYSDPAGTGAQPCM